MHTDLATRFPALDPSTATGRSAELLADLWDRHGDTVGAMTRTMAGSASLLEGYLQLSRAMKRSTLSRRDAERISIAVQARLGCDVCLDAHIRAGLAAGLTDDDIDGAMRGTAADEPSADLLEYAISVHAAPGSVDDRTIAALRIHGFTDRQLLDVVGLVTLNHLTGAFNLIAGLESKEL